MRCPSVNHAEKQHRNSKRPVKLQKSGFMSESEKYELLDSGNGRKLERWGQWVLSRPCASALWKPRLPQSRWLQADAVFDREDGNRWTMLRPLPQTWHVVMAGLRFIVSPTGFGHVGVFPEHQWAWKWMIKRAAARPNGLRFLNLFAYTGGATMAMAKTGARVCHLDSSKSVVLRARENATLNSLQDAPIRWIVEDAGKFIKREIKRKSFYDAILLDPPSFGRGNSGEVFKIENDLAELLTSCGNLLSRNPAFVVITCHTPTLTPMILSRLLSSVLPEGLKSAEMGELLLEGTNGAFSLPSGSYAAVDFENRTK
jgi:23S rRNA (cytosine1962-C5)-methyltransferase